MSVLEDVVRENNALRKENLRLKGKFEMHRRDAHNAHHHANGSMVLIDEARRLAEAWRQGAGCEDDPDERFPWEVDDETGE